jgi:anti-sigma B factor antagonist
MSFKAEISIVDTVLVVSLEGKVLEEAVLRQLLKDIDARLTEVKGKLIINIEKLDYINSTGINFFIKTLTKARVNNGDMILSGAQGSVLNIVQISKMNEVFTMTENLAEALIIHNTKK